MFKKYIIEDIEKKILLKKFLMYEIDKNNGLIL